jgi:DNA-binding XRE family transcriptional regulator
MRPRLIQERKKHKLTQEGAASFLNITTRHYQALESGDSDGSVKIWEQLSQRFDTSINDLLSQGVGIEQQDYSNSAPRGVAEMKELDRSLRGFDHRDIGVVVDVLRDGRLDEPESREAALKARDALNRVLGGAA